MRRQESLSVYILPSLPPGGKRVTRFFLQEDLRELRPQPTAQLAAQAMINSRLPHDVVVRVYPYSIVVEMNAELQITQEHINSAGAQYLKMLFGAPSSMVTIANGESDFSRLCRKLNARSEWPLRENPLDKMA